MAKPKRTKVQITNYLQNTMQKTKDQTTKTALEIGVNLGAPEGYAVPVPLVAPVMFLQLQTW